MGPEKGLKLIDASPGLAAYIVRNADGKIETHASKSWSVLKVEERK